jgi:hypothetical protein
MPANRALDAALALARNPGLAPNMRSLPLPTGIPLLLQVLADEADGASVAEVYGLDQRSLRSAIEHYVQTVMLFAGAEPTRVLGVPPGATRAEMRTHLRWLMQWLHPDQNSAAWRSAFAGRVLAAWREASNEVEKPPSVFNQARSRSIDPPRLAWIARPLRKRRRRAWWRVLGVGSVVLAVIALITVSDALPEGIRSSLRELAAILRTIVASDASDQNGGGS